MAVIIIFKSNIAFPVGNGHANNYVMELLYIPKKTRHESYWLVSQLVIDVKIVG